jgi:hypothetical protein
MELFIATVEDPGRAERLAVAIKGRGAFRRFKDELACACWDRASARSFLM